MDFLKKLQQQHAPISHQPTLAKENFLSESEISYIVEKFYEIKDPNENQFYPVPLYDVLSRAKKKSTATEIEKNQYQKIVEESREKLLTTFSNLYDKLYAQIEEFMGLPVYCLEQHNPPGFNFCEIYRPDWPFWHKDTYDTPTIQSKFFDFENKDRAYIQSFTIPLLLPENPSLGIYYDKKLDSLEINLTLENKNTDWTPEELWYETGNLYSWPGDMTHAPAPIQCTKEKPRLTIQSFGYVTKSEIYIFW